MVGFDLMICKTRCHFQHVQLAEQFVCFQLIVKHYFTALYHLDSSIYGAYG